MIKAVFKMIASLLNAQKLKKVKQELLNDTEHHHEENIIELKYRKIIRLIVLSFFTYFSMMAVIVITFPFFSNVKFAMSLYNQLPWTK